MVPFAATSHPGLKRSNNEDSYTADAALGLWLVADGVGGHAKGEVASAIVCERVKSGVASGEELTDAIKQAHAAVVQEIGESVESNNMGSTVVALRLDDAAYEIAWVGDSRAYLFDGKLRQLTQDHSVVSEMLANGAITKKQAATHPQRHALSRSLGVSARTASKPGKVTGVLEAGEQIVLCSDGLTDELSDDAIASELRLNDKPDSQVEALLNGALAAGGRDNVTIVIIGEPKRRRKREKARTPNMETTQNIGEALQRDTSAKGSGTRVAMLVFLTLCVAAAALLL